MPVKPRSKGRLDRATVPQKRSDVSGYQTVSSERWPGFFSPGKIFRIKTSDGSLRVYVVVEPGEHSSRCLMIKTYSGRATTHPDVRCRQNEHAIIYTTPLPPKPLRGEDRLRQSIGAEAEGQAQCFSSYTRLNYGQEYDVAHTERVFALAHVLKRDLSVFRADYLKIQGRVEGPSITSDEPLRSFSPSHDDSVDAIAISPWYNLSLAREDEAANGLQFLYQRNSTPETLHLPLTGEADQYNITQIVNQLEEEGGTVHVGDRGSPDNLNLDTPQGHIESAEQDTPPLLERNEDEGESELHSLAPEDPAEKQGIPVVDETDLVAIESPVTSKDVDVSTVDEKYPLDHGADPGLDNLTWDVSGTEDLDDPVYHHDRSSNPSSNPCELDYNLDGPVELIGLIQDEANAEVDSMCRTPDEAEDLEPSEPFTQASSHSPLTDQSLPKPLEAGHETIIESLYRIKTQSTPSASPGTHTHPRPDLWPKWFQLAPHEIRACPHGHYTTPEGHESCHTTTTEENSEGSLSPELAGLSASTELTAPYHTSATGVETDPASGSRGEMYEYEVGASESGSPTTAHDVSADSFSLDSNEQGLNAPELARSSPMISEPSLPSTPISPLSTASHPVLDLPPSPVPSPKLTPTPPPPRSYPPEPDPVPPRRTTQRDRTQEQGQGSYTPQSRKNAPRQPSRYPCPPPQQYYTPTPPAFPMPGAFPDTPGSLMYGGYWSSHGIYQQTPQLYPANPHPPTLHPAYFGFQGPTANSYASTPYHPTYSTRSDHHHRYQQQQQQQQQHHHHAETPRPATPEPSEVTDSSSSSAAEFEKEVYFYSAGRADKTLLYALLDTGADRNFIRLDKAEAAGLELRPCAHLNFWAGDGSVVRPKYVARGARWRFVRKGGGIIWTDEFVVLEHMPRDVILGNGVIVKRSFLLSNETLCVLGLQALTLTKDERRKREEEERRKRLSDQERIKQQNLETRQQIIEKRQKKKLLQPKPEDNKDTEDEWYDCEEDSSIVATVGSRP